MIGSNFESSTVGNILSNSTAGYRRNVVHERMSQSMQQTSFLYYFKELPQWSQTSATTTLISHQHGQDLPPEKILMCGTFLLSCPTLCDPMDCRVPDSSVHGLLQARMLEWVAMPSSRGSSRLRTQNWISCGTCTAGRFLPLLHWRTH